MPPCVWVHDAALSSEDIALRSHTDAAVIFVFDEPELSAEAVAFHRLAFVFDGVCDLFANIPHNIKEVHRGDPPATIVEFCRIHGCDRVCTTDHPDPRIRRIQHSLRKTIPLTVYPFDTLTVYPDEPKRFSRYWEKTAKQVLGYHPKQQRKHHR